MASAWLKQRNKNGWRGGLVEWTAGHIAHLSVDFSGQLSDAYQRAVRPHAQGYRVRAGGPAVALHPDALAGVAEIGGQVDALSHHNPNATFTTRGCIRRCAFCAVPRIEGNLVELQEWEPRPVICDNNLLAASRTHFDRVIDRLKAAGVRAVDFNQGLDARLQQKHHADRIAELDLKCVRLAWDETRLERRFMAAFETLRAAGIPASKIRVYVLIGYQDTPDDALYRLSTVRGLGAWPNPMRYQPLSAQRRNDYVAPGWSKFELSRYMRYWSNIRHLGGVPFDEFHNDRQWHRMNEQQLSLWPQSI